MGSNFLGTLQQKVVWTVTSNYVCIYLQVGKNLFLQDYVTEVQYGLPGKHKVGCWSQLATNQSQAFSPCPLSSGVLKIWLWNPWIDSTNQITPQLQSQDPRILEFDILFKNTHSVVERREDITEKKNVVFLVCY
jgi:hypothetical protein